MFLAQFPKIRENSIQILYERFSEMIGRRIRIHDHSSSNWVSRLFVLGILRIWVSTSLN